MPAKITRDSQGRITSYQASRAPSERQIKAILSQARQQRAKHVAMVSGVASFQGYEMQEGEARTLHYNPKNLTPERLRQQVKGKTGSEAILNVVKHSTQAEQVSGLKFFRFNFRY